MLGRLFGLIKPSRITTLAAWHPEAAPDTVDAAALRAECASPTHPGLAAIIREAIALSQPGADHHAGWPRITALINTAVTDRPDHLLLEALRRLPPANLLQTAPDTTWRHVKQCLHNTIYAVTAALRPQTAAGPLTLNLSPAQTAEALNDMVKLHHPARFEAPHAVHPEMLHALLRLAMHTRSQPALACIDRLFAHLDALAKDRTDEAYIMAEEIIAITGHSRSALPMLRRYDEETARRHAIMADIMRAGGPALEPLLRAVFTRSDQRALESPRGSAGQHPALATFLEHTPEQLGRSIMALLAISQSRNALGLQGWDLLTQRDGRYNLRASGDVAIPNCFETILELTLRRKVELGDADIAKLLRLMRDRSGLRTRNMLNIAIKAAQAVPDGQTATLLRAMINPETEAKWLPDEWIADIETSLGCVRPSLPLPTLNLTTWTAAQALAGHFTQLFDVRLHDQAHRLFLAALPEQAAALVAEYRQKAALYLRAAQDPRYTDRERAGHASAAKTFDVSHWQRYKDQTLDVATAITRQLDVLAPIIAATPAVAEGLALLASNIASKSAPAAKWLRQVQETLAPLPMPQRLALLRDFIAATQPGRLSRILDNGHNLRTLIYAAVAWPAAEIAPVLADFAQNACYKSEPGAGIADEKLGNACLWTLIHLPDGAGIPYLARLLARVKYPKIRGRIDAALNEAAEAAGISRGALDELTVPTHALHPDGHLTLAAGGGHAQLTLTETAQLNLAWVSPEGKILKAANAAMKADSAAMKAIKLTVKEIEADVAVQHIRLQRLFVENRSWAYEDWRVRYLNHPLVAPVAKRLIWRVETNGRAYSALSRQGHLENVTGEKLPTEGAIIRPWHPVEADPEDVLAWRDRLDLLGVQQPFAQAWREIYRITDAERATGTYSNRWAGHILKQHQVMALARINGWSVTHRMWVDRANDEPWHILLPSHNLLAEYWVQGAGDQDEPDRVESNAFSYVATDRLAFHTVAPGARDSARGPDHTGEAPLATIAPVVFSEIMRQCDLFTSVASIASDPEWRDRGATAEHPSQWRREAEHYWASASFADLTAAGTIRRELLERLVPRLAIAPLCGFDDQALVVRGKLHTYRIHLGSAAVQIAHTRQHVCIITKSETREAVRLPFTGDATLSLILSKAALLASDDKITDPVVLKQIR